MLLKILNIFDVPHIVDSISGNFEKYCNINQFTVIALNYMYFVSVIIFIYCAFSDAIRCVKERLQRETVCSSAAETLNIIESCSFCHCVFISKKILNCSGGYSTVYSQLKYIQENC